MIGGDDAAEILPDDRVCDYARSSGG